MRLNNLTQSGFSLLQGMIISSLLVGSALVATRLMNDQKNAQRASVSKDAIEQVHQLIYSTLQNRNHCSETLKQGGLLTADLRTVLLTATDTVAKTPKLKAIYTMTSMTDADNTTGAIYFEINDGSTYDASKIFLNHHLTIKDMTLTYPLVGDNTRLGLGRLDITYQRYNQNSNIRTKKGIGGKEIKKSIYLRIQRKTDNTASNNWDNPIDGCYALTEASGAELGNVDLAKNLCEQLNSTGTSGTSLLVWNAQLGSCTLRDLTCPTGQINAGIKPDGTADCQPLENWFSLTNLMKDSTTPCLNGYKAELRYDSALNQMYIHCYSTGGCPAETKTWYASGLTCSGNISAGSSNSIVTDSTTPDTGTATYSCVSGAWQLQAGSTCTAASSTCPAQTLTWNTNCSATTVQAPNGTSTPKTNSAAGYTGSATYLCSSGAWVLQAGSTCTAASTTCPAETKTWTEGSYSCSASIASGSGPTTITSSTPNTGSATYTCSSGNWSLQAGALCSPAPTGGPCDQINYADPFTGSFSVCACLFGGTCSGSCQSGSNPTCSPYTGGTTTGGTSTPLNCPPQDLSWSAGGYNCGISAPATNHGSSINVSSTNGTPGTATYSCNNGNFTLASDPISTCTSPIMGTTTGGTTSGDGCMKVIPLWGGSPYCYCIDGGANISCATCTSTGYTPGTSTLCGGGTTTGTTTGGTTTGGTSSGTCICDASMGYGELNCQGTPTNNNFGDSYTYPASNGICPDVCVNGADGFASKKYNACYIDTTGAM